MLPPDQIALIKATVPILRTNGKAVTDIFYHNILRDYPDLNALFNQTNQATGHQSIALANAVLAYAQYIDSPSTLAPALKHINNKHASLHIQPFQYPVVGKYLVDAFTEVAGEAFTPAIRTAWLNAFDALADVMIAAEQAIYTKSTSPTWTDWRPFTITSKTPESSEITSFTLTPTDSQPLPTHIPGQYISIRVPVPSLGYTQIRQYSVSSAPSTTHYRISVKREAGTPSTPDIKPHPGLVSNVLHTHIHEGDTVDLSHPRGDFTLDCPNPTPPTSPLILISAGVGVTPLLSMLNHTLTTDPSRPITWIQGANNSSKRAFSQHIDTIRKTNRHKKFNVIRFLTVPTDADVLGQDYDFTGRVDLQRCQEATKDDREGCLYLQDATARYFICGPEGFMDGMKGWLMDKGVNEERVQIEKFGTGGV